MVEMNEIEYRAGRARCYREYLFEDDNIDTLSWCMLLGLWETAGWICGEKGPPILRWLEPGARIG